MNYLLDTDTLIHLVRGLRAAPSATPARQEGAGKARRIVARCRSLQAQGDELCVSAITVAELEFGARGSNNYRNRSWSFVPFVIRATALGRFGSVRARRAPTRDPSEDHPRTVKSLGHAEPGGPLLQP